MTKAKKAHDDLTIPDFLKRSTTAKLIESTKKAPPLPFERKLGSNLPSEESARADAVLKQALDKRDAAITKKMAKAIKPAIEQINAERKKDGLRPYTQGKSKNSVIDKALKARDELNAKAQAAANKTADKSAAKSASAKKTAEKATKSSAQLAVERAALKHVPGKGPKQPKAKSSNGKIHRYDWAAAEEAAKKGIVPKAPDMSAWTHRYFKPLLDETEKLVKSKNLKALEAMRFKRDNGSPGMVNRYRKIAMIALRVK